MHAIQATGTAVTALLVENFRIYRSKMALNTLQSSTIVDLF